VARFEQLVFRKIRFREKEKNVNVPQAEEIRRVVNFGLVDDWDHFEELESAVRVQSILKSVLFSLARRKCLPLMVMTKIPTKQAPITAR
jgi:hypothetical protein